MERRLKERLIGAAVLVMAAVIFIPMILDDTHRGDTAITETNIPKRPEGEFTSRVVPVQESELGPDRQEPPPPETAPQAQEPRQEAAPAPAAAEQAGPPPAEQPAAEPPVRPAGKPAEEPAAKTAEPAPAPAPEKQTAPDKPTAGQGGKGATPRETRGMNAWVVQVGSFSSKDNASRLLKQLQDKGYPAFMEPAQQDSGTVYRVRVGPELLRSEAGTLKDKLTRELKMEGMLVLQYP